MKNFLVLMLLLPLSKPLIAQDVGRSADLSELEKILSTEESTCLKKYVAGQILQAKDLNSSFDCLFGRLSELLGIPNTFDRVNFQRAMKLDEEILNANFYSIAELLDKYRNGQAYEQIVKSNFKMKFRDGEVITAEGLNDSLSYLSKNIEYLVNLKILDNGAN